MSIVRIIWGTLKVFYSELFALMLMGVVTVAGLILVIPGPFAVAGLWNVAHNATEGRDTSWRVFWKGVKAHGSRNWINALVTVAVYALLAINLLFYGDALGPSVAETLAFWMRALWVGLTVVWTAVVFYLLPFQLEMVEPSLWLSLRNSLFMVLMHPIHALVWLLMLALTAFIVYALPPLVIFYPGFAAVLGITAVKTLLEPIRVSQEDPEEPVGPPPPSP